jgi:hypothetical protein
MCLSTQIRTKDPANGSVVNVELNEAGVVIDLHQANHGTARP